MGANCLPRPRPRAALIVGRISGATMIIIAFALIGESSPMVVVGVPRVRQHS